MRTLLSILFLVLATLAYGQVSSKGSGTVKQKVSKENNKDKKIATFTFEKNAGDEVPKIQYKYKDDAGGEVLKAKEVIAQGVEGEKVFDVIEQMPEFPGGHQSLFNWLSANVKYPTIAEEFGLQGRVIVTFVIERDGSITDARVVVKSVDPSLDKEALRVVSSMPRWKPGKHKGETVRVKYTVPVTFRLQ